MDGGVVLLSGRHRRVVLWVEGRARVDQEEPFDKEGVALDGVEELLFLIERAENLTRDLTDAGAVRDFDLRDTKTKNTSVGLR